MTYRGYAEADLVSNRASLLLFGGSATERRSWAEEAQRAFEAEGPLREAASAPQLAQHLAQGKGVVYVPDVAALGHEGQVLLVRCLLEREERPKLIIGITTGIAHARDHGLLREDLLYRLHQAQVDLGQDEVRTRVRARWEKFADRASKAAAKAAKGAKAQPSPRNGRQREKKPVAKKKAGKK